MMEMFQNISLECMTVVTLCGSLRLSQDLYDMKEKQTFFFHKNQSSFVSGVKSSNHYE